MRITKNFLPLSLIATSLLAGCAGMSTPQEVSLTTYAFAERPDGLTPGAGGGSDSVHVGSLKPLRYAQIAVLYCNAKKTACTQGEATIAANVTIQKVEANEVRLSIDLVSDVGRTQKVDNGLNVSRFESAASVPAQFKAIEGSSHVTKTVTTPMGQFRRLRLDHGLNLAVCVEPITAPVMLEPKCDLHPIQHGAVVQSSLPDL